MIQTRLIKWYSGPLDLHSFPTRRSSDLSPPIGSPARRRSNDPPAPPVAKDRKSTRLNSSHANNSYAVFCLKKKEIETGSMVKTGHGKELSALEDVQAAYLGM